MSAARGLNSTKQSLAEENRLRVQRQRAEQRFMRGISANYEVEHLATIRDQVANEDRTVEVTRRIHRTRVETQPESREGFTELQRFGQNIRFVEITQGGATIWTATDSGTIQIHSGKTGQVVHTVATTNEDIAVECMTATETHMWVGLSDGMVQVYDHMVFLHITEGKFHTAKITAFCPTFDGRMFSGSADGVIVRWDTEAKTFEAMSKITTSLPGISAMASHNYRLYAASTDGQLLCLDVENASALSSIIAHDSGISAAVTVDGSLFTAGADLKLKAWSCQGDSPTNLATIEIQSPVVAFAPDHGSHRLLVGHEDGTIDVLRTSVEDSFSIERTFTEYKGQNLKGLHSMTAIDSLKIWTLASNGVNKVWFSSRNKVANCMEDTINALKAVIKQDTIELDKWRNLVFRLKCVNARRKLQMATAFELHTKDLLRRRFLYLWREYLNEQSNKRRRLAISSRLGREEQIAFIRRYFVSWFRWYRYTQNTRLKTRYADILMHGSQKNATLTYFRKLQAFSRHIKMAIKRQHATQALYEHNQSFFLRTYYRRWVKFRHQTKGNVSKVNFVVALQRNTAASLRRMFYMRWLKIATRKALEQRRKKFGETLLVTNIRGLRLNAFQKWMKFLTRCKDLRRKGTLSHCLGETTNRMIMASFYSRWLLFRAKKLQEQIDFKEKNVDADVLAMRQKYAALQHIVDEKKALDDLRRQIEQEADELETRRIKFEALQNERNELARKVADRDYEAALKAKSVQEQMMSLMANLKARVINFHTDFQLMHQIREKVRANQPVTKIFLEAHQQVKRLVVELTKKPHLGVEEWPLTDQLVSKMPSHSLTVLLTAIKTMIITFDVMDRETRDSLQSDAEIVMNAKWLLVMADHSMSYRKKTLGHK